jgi:hypothetical protein
VPSSFLRQAEAAALVASPRTTALVAATAEFGRTARVPVACIFQRLAVVVLEASTSSTRSATAIRSYFFGDALSIRSARGISRTSFAPSAR